MKLVIIKNYDIVGLDDCVYNGKNLFSIECISLKGEYYKINIDVIIFKLGA
jgi:hypothetical protein